VSMYDYQRGVRAATPQGIDIEVSTSKIGVVARYQRYLRGTSESAISATLPSGVTFNTTSGELSLPTALTDGIIKAGNITEQLGSMILSTPFKLTGKAPTIYLNNLVLVNLTSAFSQQWVSAVYNLTSGSNRWAMASDGSTLSFSGDVLSGTFLTYGDIEVDVYEAAPGSIPPTRVSTSVITVSAPSLSSLVLSANTIAENTPAGQTVGVLTGMTPGTTLELSNSAGGRFALVGNHITTSSVNVNYEFASTYEVQVTERIGLTSRSTTFQIYTTNVFEQPDLSVLSLSTSNFRYTVGNTGSIVGATPGSTITPVTLPAGFSIDSSARTWTWDGTTPVGTVTMVLRETLNDSSNSGRTSTITITIVNPTVTLVQLSLSKNRATLNADSELLIIGATPGSTITGTVPIGMFIDSTNRKITGKPTTPGVTAINLIETHPYAANNNNPTVISFEVELVGTITPGTTWTGVSQSGYTSTPTDPVRTTAKPILRPIVVPEQTFSSTLLFGFGAGANNKGSLKNMGLKKVRVYFEGNVVDIPEPTYQTISDANGVARTYFGWWVRLARPNSTNGSGDVYAEAVPLDDSMQSRVMGPYTFHLNDVVYDRTVTVNSTQAAVAGSNYQTLSAALTYLKSVAARNPKITFTGGGPYTLAGSGGGSSYRISGYFNIEASAPVVFSQDTYNSASDQGRSTYDGLHFMGANITIDLKNITGIYHEGTTKKHWIDGISLTDSFGHYHIWDIGTSRQNLAAYVIRNGGWITEATFTNLANPGVSADLVRGCTFTGCYSDLVTDARCVVKTTSSGLLNTEYTDDLLAMTVVYSGTENTATFYWTGTYSAASRTFTATWGSNTASFVVYGNVSYKTSNTYWFADVVNWINGLGNGWSATLVDNTRRAMTASTAMGKAVATNSTPINVKGVTASIYSMLDIHSDWYQHTVSGADTNENVYVANNMQYDSICQNFFLTGPSKDFLFFNNAFHTPVKTTGYDQSDNLRSQYGSTHSHVVIAHNTHQNQTQRLSSGYIPDSYCLFANNSVKSFEWVAVATSTLTLTGNHIHSGQAVATYMVNTSIGGDLSSLYADSPNGVFYPTATLYSNMKPSVLDYDARGVQRGTSSVPGAYERADSLGDLTLTTNTVVENSPEGTVVGTISGKTAGSTLELVNTGSGRFALSGINIVTTGTSTDYETATAHSLSVRETLDGYINSGKLNIMTVNVTNVFESASLGVLSFSSVMLTQFSAQSGTISGKTAGSTLSISGSLPAGLTIDLVNQTWAWSGTGTIGVYVFDIVETLADSQNSGRTSTITLMVTNEVTAGTRLGLENSNANLAAGTTISQTKGAPILGPQNARGYTFTHSDVTYGTNIAYCCYVRTGASGNGYARLETIFGVNGATGDTVVGGGFFAITGFYKGAGATSTGISRDTTNGRIQTRRNGASSWQLWPQTTVGASLANFQFMPDTNYAVIYGVKNVSGSDYPYIIVVNMADGTVQSQTGTTAIATPRPSGPLWSTYGCKGVANADRCGWSGDLGELMVMSGGTAVTEVSAAELANGKSFTALASEFGSTVIFRNMFDYRKVAADGTIASEVGSTASIIAGAIGMLPARRLRLGNVKLNRLGNFWVFPFGLNQTSGDVWFEGTAPAGMVVRCYIRYTDGTTSAYKDVTTDSNGKFSTFIGSPISKRFYRSAGPVSSPGEFHHECDVMDVGAVIPTFGGTESSLMYYHSHVSTSDGTESTTQNSGWSASTGVGSTSGPWGCVLDTVAFGTTTVLPIRAISSNPRPILLTGAGNLPDGADSLVRKIVTDRNISVMTVNLSRGSILAEELGLDNRTVSQSITLSGTGPYTGSVAMTLATMKTALSNILDSTDANALILNATMVNQVRPGTFQLDLGSGVVITDVKVDDATGTLTGPGGIIGTIKYVDTTTTNTPASFSITFPSAPASTTGTLTYRPKFERPDNSSASKTTGIDGYSLIDWVNGTANLGLRYGWTIGTMWYSSGESATDAATRANCVAKTELVRRILKSYATVSNSSATSDAPFVIVNKSRDTSSVNTLTRNLRIASNDIVSGRTWARAGGYYYDIDLTGTVSNAATYGDKSAKRIGRRLGRYISQHIAGTLVREASFRTGSADRSADGTILTIPLAFIGNGLTLTVGTGGDRNALSGWFVGGTLVANDATTIARIRADNLAVELVKLSGTWAVSAETNVLYVDDKTNGTVAAAQLSFLYDNRGGFDGLEPGLLVAPKLS
jgi:hypothetical protein